MTKDAVAIRINQLSTLHSQLNGVLMNAKKLYIPAEVPDAVKDSSVVSVLETAQLSIKHEIEELRKQL